MKKSLSVLALVAALTAAPVFADPAGTSSISDTEVKVSVPEYYQIELNSSSKVDGGTAEISTTGTGVSTAKPKLTMANAIQVKFDIVTNMTDQKFYISPKVAKEGGTGYDTAALDGDGSSPTSLLLVMGHETNKPKGDAITAAISGDAKDSANAIAFTMSASASQEENTAAPVITTTAVTANGVNSLEYTISPGTSYITLDIATTGARAESFSMKDTAGTYKAQILVTRTNS